ncbi:Uncharacterised protein [Klebsiella pneumoniae]|nr:Uncharacterised protein [Klebsiella pneumoniae]
MTQCDILNTHATGERAHHAGEHHRDGGDADRQAAYGRHRQHGGQHHPAQRCPVVLPRLTGDAGDLFLPHQPPLQPPGEQRHRHQQQRQ